MGRAVPALHNAQGEVIGLNIVAEKVTEQRRTAQALEEAAEYRRLVLEAGEVGTWSFGADRHLVVDKRTQYLLALDQQRLSLREALAHVHPDDRAMMRAALRDAQRAPSGQLSADVRLRSGRGGVAHVLARGRVFFEEATNGAPKDSGHGTTLRPRRTFGVVIDVTERLAVAR